MSAVKTGSDRDIAPCSREKRTKVVVVDLQTTWLIITNKINKKINFNVSGSMPTQIVTATNVYDMLAVFNIMWFLSSKKRNSQQHTKNGNTAQTTRMDDLVLATQPFIGPVNDTNVYCDDRNSFLIRLFHRGWEMQIERTSRGWILTGSFPIVMSTIRSFRTITRTLHQAGFNLKEGNKLYTFIKYTDAIGVSWALSRREMNSRAHALNGNTSNQPQQKQKGKKFLKNNLDAIKTKTNQKTHIRLTIQPKENVEKYFISNTTNLNTEGLAFLMIFLKRYKMDLSTSYNHIEHNFEKIVRSLNKKKKLDSTDIEEIAAMGLTLTMLSYGKVDLFKEEVITTFKDESNPIHIHRIPIPKFVATLKEKEIKPPSTSRFDDTNLPINHNSSSSSTSSDQCPSSKQTILKKIKESKARVGSPKKDESKSVDEDLVSTLIQKNDGDDTLERTLISNGPIPFPDSNSDRPNNGDPKTEPQQIIKQQKTTGPVNQPNNQSISPQPPSQKIMWHPGMIISKPVHSKIVGNTSWTNNLGFSMVNFYGKIKTLGGHIGAVIPTALYTFSQHKQKYSPNPGAGIIINDDSLPGRGFFSELQQVEIVNYSEFKKVLIKNDSFKNMFKTPDIISSMKFKNLFETPSDETVRLPDDYMIFSASYWATKSSMSEEEYHLFCIKTVALANTYIMPNEDYMNLVIYGPRIALNEYRPTFTQLNSTIRTNRQLNKLSKIDQIFQKFGYIYSGVTKLCKYLFTTRAKVKSFSITPILSSLYNFRTITYESILSCKISVTPITTKFTRFVSKTIDILDNMFNFIPLLPINPIRNLGLYSAGIISPLVEEYNRTELSTALNIGIELFIFGNPFSPVLHMTNYMLSLCPGTFCLRLFIHTGFNMGMLYYGLPYYVASSMLAQGINFLYSKKQLIKKSWADARRYFSIDSLMPTPKELRRGGVMKDTNPFCKMKKEKIQHYVIGPTLEGYEPISFDTSKQNEKVAIEQRILKKTPDADPITLRRFFLWIKRNRKKIFPKTCRTKVESVSFESYISSSGASPGVKKKLIRMKEILNETGIDETTKLTKNQRKKFTLSESFVKNENLNYRTKVGILEKAPRLIQGRPKEFIVLVGPWIAALQNNIKRDWHKKNFICFTSGVNNQDAARLVTEFDYWLEDDVSAWDASCCEQLLEIEWWLYNSFRPPLAVRDLLRSNINTRGRTTKGWFYSRSGCRKSGDPYTSLGNSILNGLIHLYIFCVNQRKSVNEAKKVLRMLVQGDDSLINTFKPYNINWQREMLAFGFKAEGIHRTNKWKVEFCSMRLYAVKQGIVFAPMIGKVVCKFGVYCDPDKKTHALSILRGSAMGLIPACSGIPILQEFINKILLLTTGVEGLKVRDPVWRLNFKQSEFHSDSLLSLNDVYGLDTGAYNSIVGELEKLRLSSTNFGTYLNYIIDQDSSGPHVYLP